MGTPFRLRDDGVDLFVRLTPKAAMDRLEGMETAADGRSHFKARVRAVPENGAANQRSNDCSPRRLACRHRPCRSSPAARPG